MERQLAVATRSVTAASCSGGINKVVFATLLNTSF